MSNHKKLLLLLLLSATASLYSATPFELLVRQTRNFIATLYRALFPKKETVTSKESSDKQKESQPEQKYVNPTKPTSTPSVVKTPSAKPAKQPQEPSSSGKTADTNGNYLPSLEVTIKSLLAVVPFWDATYPQALPSIPLETIKKTLQLASKDTSFYQPNRWVAAHTPHQKIAPSTFNCVIERLLLPPNSTCYFMGPIAGDARSLGYFLSHLSSNGLLSDDFTLRDYKTYLIFLGNYSGEQLYGLEVLTVLSYLRDKNPDNVILVRSKHETLEMSNKNGVLGSTSSTQANELSKYGIQNTAPLKNELSQLLVNFYNTLPVALFITTEPVNDKPREVIACSNAGIEIGIDPLQLLQERSPIVRYQYITEIHRILPKEQFANNGLPVILQIKELANQNKITTEAQTRSLGFFYGDFLIDSEASLSYDPARGLQINKAFTSLYANSLIQNNVQTHAIFRAHQNGDNAMLTELHRQEKVFPALAGIVRLWPDAKDKEWEEPLPSASVVTFMPTPENNFGKKQSEVYWYIGELKINTDTISASEFQVLPLRNATFETYLKTKVKGKEKAD